MSTEETRSAARDPDKYNLNGKCGGCGEDVAMPDWFDQAAELVADIDRGIPRQTSDGCRTCHRPWTECEC